MENKNVFLYEFWPGAVEIDHDEVHAIIKHYMVNLKNRKYDLMMTLENGTLNHLKILLLYMNNEDMVRYLNSLNPWWLLDGIVVYRPEWWIGVICFERDVGKG